MGEKLLRSAKSLMEESIKVYLTLLKILVPALTIVKLLMLLGVANWLAQVLSPVMGALGLPPELAIVWATTLLTNIYAGMVVFFTIGSELPLTVAQVTVLGTLMIIGHALPVEGAVARAAGVPWWLTLLLRVGGPVLLGWLLHRSYLAGDWLQEANTLAWQPAPSSDGLIDWMLQQLSMLAVIYFVILGLMLVLRLLRQLGIERLLHWLLSPVLGLIGLGRNAANTTIIGLTLGLSFGAGLLIRDARSGNLSSREALLTLSFLGLCHSLIEDTLLIMLLGADLSGILWARLAFSLLVMVVISRLYPAREKAQMAPDSLPRCTDPEP